MLIGPATARIQLQLYQSFRISTSYTLSHRCIYPVWWLRHSFNHHLHNHFAIQGFPFLCSYGSRYPYLPSCISYLGPNTNSWTSHDFHHSSYSNEPLWFIRASVGHRVVRRNVPLDISGVVDPDLQDLTTKDMMTWALSNTEESIKESAYVVRYGKGS